MYKVMYNGVNKNTQLCNTMEDCVKYILNVLYNLNCLGFIENAKVVETTNIKTGKKYHKRIMITTTYGDYIIHKIIGDNIDFKLFKYLVGKEITKWNY